jgi:peptide chain release factor 3
VETTLEALPYSIARWVTAGWEAVESAGRLFNTQVVKDVWGRPVLLFRNEYSMAQVLADAGDKLGELSSYGLPPDS